MSKNMLLFLVNRCLFKVVCLLEERSSLCKKMFILISIFVLNSHISAAILSFLKLIKAHKLIFNYE